MSNCTLSACGASGSEMIRWSGRRINGLKNMASPPRGVTFVNNAGTLLIE